MLWPHYGLGMCQAAALLLVLRHPPYWQKTVKKSLQLTWNLTNEFYQFTFTRKWGVWTEMSSLQA